MMATCTTVTVSLNYPMERSSWRQVAVARTCLMSGGRHRRQRHGIWCGPQKIPPRPQYNESCLPFHVGPGGTTSTRWIGCTPRPASRLRQSVILSWETGVRQRRPDGWTSAHWSWPKIPPPLGRAGTTMKKIPRLATTFGGRHRAGRARTP